MIGKVVGLGFMSIGPFANPNVPTVILIHMSPIR